MAQRLASKAEVDKRRRTVLPVPHRPRVVVCHGEMLLRLSGRAGERLFQTPDLQVHVGGAEANVAVALARLGHSTRMLSVVPAHAAGFAVLEALQRHSVDTGGVLTEEGRMGLYFLESAAAGRAGEVIYDRAGSAFARHGLPRSTMDAALDGAALLHTSGITPALGGAPRRNLHALWKIANTSGIDISFDCKFRPTLWTRREAQARQELTTGLSVARVAFADERVLALLQGDAPPRRTSRAGFARRCSAAFRRHPDLQQIAATSRTEHTAGRHELRAMLGTRQGLIESGPLIVDPVLDRIGTGDAFAAAMLLARLEGMRERQALDLALAACALKHSFAGDFNLASRAQIEALAAGHTTGIRR